MARLDDPITDIIFVCSEENCPKGYTVISKSPCGREAQLWEKVWGGVDGTRFLCFTKEDKDGTVIEEMYIPRRSADRLRPEFKIIEKTVEGKEPMYHRQLAVKKVHRSKAKKVVADVIVCRGRDNVSKLYKRMDKVNGLRICFRQTAYTPPKIKTDSSPTHTSARRTSDPEAHLQFPKEEGVQNRRATVASDDTMWRKMDHLVIVGDDEIDSDDDHSHYTPSPPSTPDGTFPDHPAGTYDATISDRATVHIGGQLESIPPQPQPPPSEPSQTGTATSYYPPPPTDSSASYSNSYTTPTQSMPTQAQASGSGFYQPTAAYPLPQQQTPSYNYSQPPTAGYSPQPAGYGQPSGIGFSAGYPSPQPPTTAPGYSNYAAIAGSSFMGTAPTGPAPYNPFQQGAAAPYPPPAGTYPTAPPTGTYPPPPTGTGTYPPPPTGTGTYPPRPSGQNYGFNF